MRTWENDGDGTVQWDDEKINHCEGQAFETLSLKELLEEIKVARRELEAKKRR